MCENLNNFWNSYYQKNKTKRCAQKKNQSSTCFSSVQKNSYVACVKVSELIIKTTTYCFIKKTYKIMTILKFYTWLKNKTDFGKNDVVKYKNLNKIMY